MRMPEEDGYNVRERMPLGLDPPRNKLFIATCSTLTPYGNGVGWLRRRPPKHPMPIFAHCRSIRCSLSRGLLQYKRKIVHTRARLAHWRRDTDINPRGLDKFVTAVRYKNSGRDRCFVPFLFPFLFSAFFP